MFTKKRQLKRDKLKARTKFGIIIFILLFFAILVFEYIYLNFSFSRNGYVSPIAKNTTSKTFNLEKKLDQMHISFISVKENNDGSLTVEIPGGALVILSSKKDIGSQLSSLQLILSRLTIEGKKLKSLDMRFDSPVILF